MFSQMSELEKAYEVLKEVVNFQYFATLDDNMNVLVKPPLGLTFTKTALNMLQDDFQWMIKSQWITDIICHPYEKDTFILLVN